MDQDPDKTRQVGPPPEADDGPMAPADRVGTVLAGRYRILELLGEGAQGSVYVGEHLKIGRKDAIKVLRPELLDDADAVGRFTRGASKASHISHPNVCTVYDFGDTEDGLPFMASELVADGRELQDVMEAEAPFDLERAVDIALQAAAGLHAAHDLDVVHRDLKPANIMVTRGRDGSEVVKVVDFDIAKGIGDAEESGGLTKTGWIIGTPKYMSPEQISGDELDGRSDLYSLALILFEMLTGDLPNEPGSTRKVMWARVSEDLRDLSEVRPGANFPSGLQDFFDRALSSDPEQRIPTAREFSEELDRIMRGGPAVPPTRMEAPEDPDATVAVETSPDDEERTGAGETVVLDGSPAERRDIPPTRVEASTPGGPPDGAGPETGTRRKILPVAGVVVVAAAGVAVAVGTGVLGGGPVPILEVPETVELEVGGATTVDARLVDASTGESLEGEISYAMLTESLDVAALAAGGRLRAMAAGTTWVVVRADELADTVPVVVTPPTGSRMAAGDGQEDTGVVDGSEESRPGEESGGEVTTGAEPGDDPSAGSDEEDPGGARSTPDRSPAEIHRALSEFNLRGVSSVPRDELRSFRDTTAVLWTRDILPDSTRGLLAYLQTLVRAQLEEDSEEWCLWARRARDAYEAAGEGTRRALTPLLTQCDRSVPDH